MTPRKPQSIMRAHRMREHEIGAWRLARRGKSHKRVKIAFIIRKGFDVTFLRIGQQSIRQSLPAPIQRDHVTRTFEEPRCGVKIFVDEFGPAVEQKDGADRRSIRGPMRGAQIHAIGGPKRCGRTARRAWIARYFDESQPISGSKAGPVSSPPTCRRRPSICRS